MQFLDLLALSDPLLSRLPVDDKKNWAIAHFERSIPHGYIESLKNGGTRLSNQGLARYYGKLSQLTRGNLTDVGRLKEVALFNLGHYDKFLAQYSPDSIDVNMSEDTSYAQVFSAINESIELDRMGRMEEAAAVHLNLILDKKPMLLEHAQEFQFQEQS